MKKIVEREGAVVVSDRGEPKYLLTLYTPPPKAAPRSKDYLARMKKFQPRPMSARPRKRCTRRIVATADAFYVDPSALLKLYLHQPESAAMNAWRAKTKGALPLTHHGRVEVVNGICLTAHRREIGPEALADSLASFDEDVGTGLYRQADLLWRATLNRAAELGRSHSAKLGTRSLDVLHVASALELGVHWLVSYDFRQEALARAVGLRVLAP